MDIFHRRRFSPPDSAAAFARRLEGTGAGSIGFIRMDGSLIVVDSPLDAATTRERIVHEITAAGNAIFADLDQAALARGAGLELRPTYVVLFGNPRAGTPLMAASALAAYELPLKLLIWSENDRTHVAYRPPSLMSAEYSLADQAGRLAAMDGAIAAIVKRAVAAG